eukprot:TRINITY_DN22435_c0_g1_i1.p1 TRINITY_DN22435_c0_g1~~TRINITY_DN22435_c0_g1_i1.p1  ORF type:complete len:629 (+),score=276.58 TRINITY_DN22435_c0_g1_i1:39-1889(+)
MASMQRRTTLGALNPNALNSRASVGPSKSSEADMGFKKMANNRLSMAVPRKQSSMGGSRLSMASTSSSRRSSVYGGKGGRGKRSDPRPIKDKEFQKQSRQKIIRFLSEHMFDKSLEPKDLQGPSTKDFLHILQFLYNIIDPHFKFSAKNPEEEVVMIFSTLKYPIKINKSAVVAPGSPHSWPSMLAALVWICDLLDFQEKKQSREENDEDILEDMGERLFFDYLSQAYEIFLTQDYDDSQADEIYEPLKDEFQARFEHKNAEVAAQNEELEAEKADLERQLSEFEGPSQLEEATTRKNDVEADVAKFERLINDLENHEQLLQRKLIDHSQELESKKEELKRLVELQEKLQVQLEAQEINEEDVKRINSERNELQQELSEVSANRDRLDKVIWQQELQINEQQMELDGTLEVYNSKVEALDLVPSTTENANGVEFSLELNMEATKAKDVLSGDLKGTIKPALNALKETFAINLSTAEQDQEVSRAQIERISRDVEALEMENSELEEMIKEREDECQSTKNAMKRLMDRHDRQMENISKQIQDLQSANPNALKETNKQLNEKKQLLQKLEIQFEAEKAELIGVFSQTVERLTKHKAHVESRLSELRQTCEDLKEQVQE